MPVETRSASRYRMRAAPGKMHPSSGSPGNDTEGETVRRFRWVAVLCAVALVGAVTVEHGRGPERRRRCQGGAHRDRRRHHADRDPHRRDRRHRELARARPVPGLGRRRAGVGEVHEREGGRSRRPQDRRRHLRLRARPEQGPQRDHRGVREGLRDRRHVGAVREQRRRPASACKDTKGAATGLPDFPVLTTEVVHQCSPVSYPINPPILDCDTKDQKPADLPRLRSGATNYYLKKFGKNALHGLFVYPSRPQVGEELAGAGVHGPAGGGHQAGRDVRRVGAGPAVGVHAVRPVDQGQPVHLRPPRWQRRRDRSRS